MTYLYARDIAERRGISRRAARAWLLRLEREHGPRVVGRTGNRLFTTEDALATVAPGFDATRRRIANLEDRVRKLSAMVRTLGQAIVRLDDGRRGARAVPHEVRDVEIDST